jgi:phenylpropionate dioxygenase-like ring-hydroxylating dioxygenase large terminal subunit
MNAMPGDAIHPPPKDCGPLAQRLMDGFTDAYHLQFVHPHTVGPFFQFADGLPRTPTGKVRKGELRASGTAGDSIWDRTGAEPSQRP